MFFWNKTKDNLLPQRDQPQPTCPQSSFTLMSNSTGRPMSMLALYNNLILDQFFFLREILGFINATVNPFVDIRRREWRSLPFKCKSHLKLFAQEFPYSMEKFICQSQLETWVFLYLRRHSHFIHGLYELYKHAYECHQFLIKISNVLIISKRQLKSTATWTKFKMSQKTQVIENCHNNPDLNKKCLYLG